MYSISPLTVTVLQLLISPATSGQYGKSSLHSNPANAQYNSSRAPNAGLQVSHFVPKLRYTINLNVAKLGDTNTTPLL